MKKYLFIIFVLSGLNSMATTTFAVGASRTYTTIAAAYAACTGSTDYVIEIYNDYDYDSETATGANPISLGYLSNLSASYTVTIRPASGQSLSFSGTASSIFILDGANWVILDGRAGGSGASAWTIINSNTASNKRAFTLINDASNNVLKYCTMKANNNSSIILFSTSNVGSGNDNNMIDHCTIRENITFFPLYSISSTGTVGQSNSGNTISNCDLVNFKSASIYLSTGNESWTITNNNFYQDQAVSFTGSLRFIWINDGSGYTISGNSMGGSASNCGGSVYTRTITTATAYFSVICFTNSTVGTVNTISGNTIANLNISSTTFLNSQPVLSLIYITGAGDFIIGSSGNGNTFGATSGTGNIVITYNNADGYYTPSFDAISLNSTGSSTVEYNDIGSIDYIQVQDYSELDVISMIRIASSGNVTITNNTIGNTTTDNITITSQSARLSGILADISITPLTSPISLTISDNIIQNLTILDDVVAVFGTLSKLYGMFISGIGTPVNINGNTVKYLRSATSNPDATGFNLDAIVTGIYTAANGSGFDWNIYDNKIQSLSNSIATGNQVNVIGICIYSGSTGGETNVYRNRIKTISNSSTNSNSGVIGLIIYYYDGLDPKIFNNVVILSDGANTVAKKLVGIELMADNLPVLKIYYNTIKLFASYSSGSGVSSAIYLNTNAMQLEIKNNIFQNVSTGGSGEHYAQFWGLEQLFSWTQSHNFNEAPNASKLISYNSTDYTIAGWRTLIGDGTSTEKTGSISISSSTGVASSNSIVGSAGTPIAGITTDFDLNARSVTNPWMGAYETIIPLSISLLEMKAKCQKSKTSNSEYGGTVRWSTVTETNNDYYIVQRSEDGFEWRNLDTIDGSGTCFIQRDYYFHESFSNPTPEKETIIYYRVSQTDFDGVVNTYDILSCKCEASDKVKIHPVPATEYIIINFGDQNNVPNSFQITDMFGRIIQDVVIKGGKEGNTSYKLDVQNYASGRYIIKINDWKMKEDAVFIKQ